MRVKSFIKNGIEWCPVEIELSFLPGLPRFQFLGLPDMALKESQWRIKSALKNQGFDWPKGKQIIVNMKPHNVRKSSQGLELAIVCAFLWASGQVKKSPLLADVPWVYGELGLEGEVLAPEDVFRAETEMGSEILLTGTSDNAFPFNTVQLKSLKDLSQIEVVSAQSVNQLQQASAFEERYFCQKSAKLMAIIATGEHSALMVGPAGSGKTTLCESIPPLLKSPSIKEKKEIRRWALAMNWPLEDRPFVMPHHSTPNISMIGGGIPPMPGEITRAHKGVLVLDELLEFSNPVKESLREPIVSGQISVSRRGVKKEYPADFLLLATSNLCPCGQLVPKTYNSCRFSLTKCRSYTEKLSGPLADRFHILAYSHLWEKKEEVALSQIKEQVQQAQAFAKQARQQELVNSKLSTAQILATCDHFLSHGGMPEFTGSRRRFKAVLQVARTLADLQQCEKISLKQVQTAMSYAQLPFMELQQIFA